MRPAFVGPHFPGAFMPTNSARHRLNVVMRHTFTSICIRAIAGILLSGLGPTAFGQTREDPSGADFFEKRIRPVLTQQCYRCHSQGAEKLKAKLYLDSRAGMLKGGDNGPAIVPGHPEKSLLIEAIQ